MYGREAACWTFGFRFGKSKQTTRNPVVKTNTWFTLEYLQRASQQQQKQQQRVYSIVKTQAAGWAPAWPRACALLRTHACIRSYNGCYLWFYASSSSIIHYGAQTFSQMRPLHFYTANVLCSAYKADATSRTLWWYAKPAHKHTHRNGCTLPSRSPPS